MLKFLIPLLFVGCGLFAQDKEEENWILLRDGSRIEGKGEIKGINSKKYIINDTVIKAEDVLYIRRGESLWASVKQGILGEFYFAEAVEQGRINLFEQMKIGVAGYGTGMAGGSTVGPSVKRMYYFSEGYGEVQSVSKDALLPILASNSKALRLGKGHFNGKRNGVLLAVAGLLTSGGGMVISFIDFNNNTDPAATFVSRGEALGCCLGFCVGPSALVAGLAIALTAQPKLKKAVKAYNA